MKSAYGRILLSSVASMVVRSLSSSIPPGLASPGVVSPSVPLHSLRSTRRGGGRKEDDTKEERRVQEWNGRD